MSKTSAAAVTATAPSCPMVRAREAVGLTLEQAACKALVSVDYLRDIERKGGGAPSNLAERLAGIYRCSVFVFLRSGGSSQNDASDTAPHIATPRVTPVGSRTRTSAKTGTDPERRSGGKTAAHKQPTTKRGDGGRERRSRSLRADSVSGAAIATRGSD